MREMTEMGTQLKFFGDEFEEKKFHYSQKAIDVNNVDIEKILVPE